MPFMLRGCGGLRGGLFFFGGASFTPRGCRGLRPGAVGRKEWLPLRRIAAKSLRSLWLAPGFLGVGFLYAALRECRSSIPLRFISLAAFAP